VADSTSCIAVRFKVHQLETALQGSGRLFGCAAVFALSHDFSTSGEGSRDIETVMLLVKGHEARRQKFSSKLIQIGIEPWFEAVMRHCYGVLEESFPKKALLLTGDAVLAHI